MSEEMQDLMKYAKKACIKTITEKENKEDKEKKKARDMARDSYLKGVSKGFKGE